MIGYSLINGILSQSQNRYYSAGLTLSKNKQNKYAINLAITPGYLVNKFSLQSSSSNNAFTMVSAGRLVLFLPAKVQLMTDISHNYIARTVVLPGQQTTILNSMISKMFFKDNNLKISLSGNDFLNQNMDVSRQVTGNTIVQYAYTGIRRYLMPSVAWDFNKFKTIISKK